jgi:hypothetical protein
MPAMLKTSLFAFTYSSGELALKNSINKNALKN